MHSAISRSAIDAQDRPEVTLQAATAALDGHVQLLRRRILRADGVSTLERDMLLSTLADIAASAEQLNVCLVAIERRDTRS